MRLVKPFIMCTLLLFANGIAAQAGENSTGHRTMPAHKQKPASVEHAEPSHTQGQKFDDDTALKFSQSVIKQQVGDFVLLDREGKRIRLADFRGKPLVVSMIYTGCYHICPAITQNLARTVKAARNAVGTDSFTVITIGFDYPRDRPETMRTFARQQGISREVNWKFMSVPDKQTIQHLAKQLGFIYFASPKGFDHLAQTTVIDADGKVYRQVYGQAFEAPMLVEPLKELVFGNPARQISLSSFINKVRLWCTVYDPATESYRFDYAMILGLIVAVIMLAVFGVVLIRMWLKALRPDDS